MPKFRNVEYAIRPRGGVGRSAKWDWEIYSTDGDVIGVESGSITGARQKAVDAACVAIDGYLATLEPTSA